jgi:hypothetical protein
MSKSAPFIFACLLLGAIVLGWSSPFWFLHADIGDAAVELGADAMGGLFGLMVGVAAALLGLAVAAIVVLLAGPAALMVTLFVLLVVAIVTVVALLLGLLPLALPILVVVAIVWLATRRGPNTPPRLPASGA